jgi:allophanate hydrolase subunit 2
LSIRILKLATGAAFQDAGRPGFRRYGVPAGGAFDRESHDLALRLVGRTDGETLEIPAPGIEFEALEPDLLSLAGAVCIVEKNDRFLSANSSFEVAPGDRVSIRPLTRGIRFYLASGRGWTAEPILGSVSGIEPEAVLACQRSAPGGVRSRRLSRAPSSLAEGPFRVLPGPQARERDLADLLAGRFSVSLRSNRVGLRLEGGNFGPIQELTSEPSCPGAIQLAPSGELLVHGPDGPTVGGYPKVAVVAQADFDRLGQLRPLQEVRFDLIDLQAARALRSRRASDLARRLREIEAALKT